MKQSLETKFIQGGEDGAPPSEKAKKAPSKRLKRVKRRAVASRSGWHSLHDMSASLHDMPSYLPEEILRRGALRPRASTPPLVSNPVDTPSITTSEQPSR